MMTFVTWKWRAAGYRTIYGPRTVNLLAAMVARHYSAPHRFLCVTDEAQGLAPGIEVVKPWDDFVGVPSPHGPRYPSCYRRLRAFAPDIEASFGPRFVMLDLDTVIVGDLGPLVTRPEAFVAWADPMNRGQYNPSVLLLTAGARPQVWTAFNPALSPAWARKAGFLGSDQAWISAALGRQEATFTIQDGVWSFRHLQYRARLPEVDRPIRVVNFHGAVKPWSAQAQDYQWVREAYRL